MNARVLVVDDDAGTRLLCRASLAAEGIEVLEAADGPSGLEIARSQRPDLILLDVTMTPLDGWRVAEQLRDDPTTASIPVIVMATQDEFGYRPGGLHATGIDYITKPFNPVNLLPLLDRLLGR